MHIKTYFAITKLLSSARFLYPSDLVKVKNQNPHPPTFILGAPRTGTTLLYQWITNTLTVAYLDNLAHLFPYNQGFGAGISQFIFDQKPHNVYKSDFGRTQRFSLHAPHEGGTFFHRLKQLDSSQSQQVLNHVMAKSKLPWIFKNLNILPLLPFLRENFPQAHYIYCERDLLPTAISIWEARKKLQVKDTSWWSVETPDQEKLNTLPLHQKIVGQILSTKKEIEKHLSSLSNEQVMRLRYESLSEDQDELWNRIQQFMGEGCQKRKGAKSLTFRESTRLYEQHPEYASFLKEIEKTGQQL